ncbi:MAG: MtrB/PioB family decaheme-associated outer membrane protein [Gammaproteobacteria bacterium]|nr:MtrB/PioB family decaheme-associated outer membrane protein [Gammaproteobacteria bacterium]
MKRFNAKCYSLLTAITVLYFHAAIADEDSFLLEDEPTQESEPLTSQLEIGIGYNSANSHRFGQYTGLTQQQPFFIGAFNIIQRDDYQSNSSQYWTLTGTNLGLSSRRFDADYGQQGRFKLHFNFDQLPNNRLDDARTPFRGASQAQLSLPGEWQPGLFSNQFTNLATSLQSENIATERKRYLTQAQWSPSKHLSLDFLYHHENKQGTDTIGSVFGSSSFTPFAAILPKAVDQDSDQFQIKASYNHSLGQMELRYRLSLFNNHIPDLSWQNPYTQPRLIGFPQGQGRLALEPDHLNHQVAFQGGMRLGTATRVSASFSYGKTFQNNRLLPFTVNQQLTVNEPLPGTKSKASAKRLHAKLSLATRPLRKLQLRARYQYDERDNNTNQRRFFVLRNDSENQINRLDSTTVRYNLPYGYKKHKVSLETGYRLFNGLKLTTGYRFLHTSRQYSQVDNNNEHRGLIKLSFSPSPLIQGWLQYQHAERNADRFDHAAIFRASHSQPFLASLPTDQQFQNDPLLRQFNLANREQRIIQFSTTFHANDDLHLNLSARYTDDTYPQTITGLKNWQSLATTLELDYTIHQQLSFFSYLTYERIDSLQQGFNHSSRAETLPPRNPDEEWRVDNLDQVYTTGAGFNWQLLDNQLNLQLDYTYSNARTTINPTLDASPRATNLPDLTTRLHAMTLKAEYQLEENWLMRVNYRLEKFNTRDFAQDGILNDTVPQVLSLGNQSPDYFAHLGWLSVVYSF